MSSTWAPSPPCCAGSMPTMLVVACATDGNPLWAWQPCSDREAVCDVGHDQLEQLFYRATLPWFEPAFSMTNGRSRPMEVVPVPHVSRHDDDSKVTASVKRQWCSNTVVVHSLSLSIHHTSYLPNTLYYINTSHHSRLVTRHRVSLRPLIRQRTQRTQRVGCV